MWAAVVGTYIQYGSLAAWPLAVDEVINGVALRLWHFFILYYCISYIHFLEETRMP